MRVVVGLFDEGELLTLRLVETSLDGIRLLELLESENEELRVVLVGERGEGDRSELARFEPVNRGGVDGDGLLGRDVGLQVVASVTSRRRRRRRGDSLRP